MATLDTGDEVIVPAPYWVSYPDMVLANDGTPVVVPCPEAEGFKLTPRRLESAITDRTRWVILNAPGNPTGSAYTVDELRALADVLLAHPHVQVLTDEIYDEIWYEPGQVPSLAAVEPRLTDRVFLTNGVSKTYAMTGWRIGYGAGPPTLVAASTPCSRRSRPARRRSARPPLPPRSPATRTSSATVCRLPRPPRRDREAHQRHPAAVLHPPTAASTLRQLPDVLGKRTPAGEVIELDEDFARYLLESQQVAVIHGTAYGSPGYFRISFATSTDVLTEACERIGRACADLSPADPS
jgi:aspartate aminotransferase